MGKIHSCHLHDDGYGMACILPKRFISSFAVAPGVVLPVDHPLYFPKRKIIDTPLDYVWHPDNDGKEEEDLHELDSEMRIQAQGLMEDHKLPDEASQVIWRCAPMDEMDPTGYEGAMQSGAVPFSMKAGSDGKIGIQVPKKPPIFDPVDVSSKPREDIPGLKGTFTQLLRDPAGHWYWVMTADGAPLGFKKSLLSTDEYGPVEQPVASTMMCAEGKHKWEAQTNGQGIFELEKRATSFLEIGRPVELKARGFFDWTKRSS